MAPEAVAAALKRTIKKVPAAEAILSKRSDFQITDRTTLVVRTPVPSPQLAQLLSLWYFGIQKSAADGTFAYTGPFIPSDYVEKQSITLTAYPAYRGGAARTNVLKVRAVPDVATRVLALQSGDVGQAQQGLSQLQQQMQSARAHHHHHDGGGDKDGAAGQTQAAANAAPPAPASDPSGITGSAVDVTA